MKIAASRAEAFLARPDPAVAVVLIYGPDAGLVRERSTRLVRQVAEDPSDPFRVAELEAAALRDDPARLADEAAALSLTGGRRVVRVRGAADALAPALEDLLAAGAPAPALVVVEAGDLGPRSPLRRLLEAAAAGAAVPCYADDGGTLADVIRESLAAARLSASPDAMAFLQERLGGDRLLTRAELEKLALYAGGPGRKAEITLEDAAACVGDVAGLAVDDAVFAATEGDFAGLDRCLARLFAEGVAPVTLLRAALRHVQRLHLAACAVAGGESAERAMQALRPPVFFRRQASFRAALGRWTAARLAGAMRQLTEAEAACKQTGIPDTAVAERALLRLANVAARSRRA